MAGTLMHHVDAAALLPWTATAAKPAANLAALQYGRTARRHDRGGLVPRGGRSRTPAESRLARSIVSGGRITRGWRDGAYWAAWSVRGPDTTGIATRHQREPGSRPAAWRGPRSRQDPRPQTPAPEPQRGDDAPPLTRDKSKSYGCRQSTGGDQWRPWRTPGVSRASSGRP